MEAFPFELWILRVTAGLFFLIIIVESFIIAHQARKLNGLVLADFNRKRRFKNLIRAIKNPTSTV